MTRRKYQKPIDQPRKSVRRRCLMCHQTFQSDGAHNRICKKCKSTQAWRDGASISEFRP